MATLTQCTLWNGTESSANLEFSIYEGAKEDITMTTLSSFEQSINSMAGGPGACWKDKGMGAKLHSMTQARGHKESVSYMLHFWDMFDSMSLCAVLEICVSN
ncbi:hypothetical protein Gotri_010999, partial [Gossypium trilobum]|nr:hypothetical protein [Gossypium trilobum]